MFAVPMKKLILNADDFGMTRGVNEGIVRAHREGILTSTTLMADGHAFDDAVERARANPNWELVATWFSSAGSAWRRGKDVASLADANGNLPESLPFSSRRITSGMIRGEEIEQELRAQIEKIRAAGIDADASGHPQTYACSSACDGSAG